jgi:hypothetical protein
MDKPIATKTDFVFLGAGASREAGVPVSFEMSFKLAELMNPLEPWHIVQVYKEACPPDPFCKAFRFALGALLAKRGAAGLNPLDGVDVEELFNVIEALSHREDLEINPFVTWSEAVDRIEDVPDGLEEYQLEEVWRETCSLVQSITGNADLNPKERAKILEDRKDRFVHTLRGAIGYTSGVARHDWIFQETLTVMKRLLCRMCWIEQPDRVAYLNPLVKYCAEEKVPIASINYDNAIELTCRQLGIDCKTGIDGWTSPVVTDGNSTVELIKLHGSVDWRLTSYLPCADKPAPELNAIREDISDSTKDFDFLPAVIFGQRNKLTADGPFLRLLRQFEQHLDGATTITVIGYSFRDRHINDLMCKWLNAKPSRKINVVNGTSFKLENISFADKENSTFLCDRINIISAKASEGIASLFAT